MMHVLFFVNFDNEEEEHAPSGLLEDCFNKTQHDSQVVLLDVFL